MGDGSIRQEILYQYFSSMKAEEEVSEEKKEDKEKNRGKTSLKKKKEKKGFLAGLFFSRKS